MPNTILAVLLFLASCTYSATKTNETIVSYPKHYDFEISIELLDPFVAPTKMYSLSNDTLMAITNTYSYSRELVLSDSNRIAVGREETDSIYILTNEVLTPSKEQIDSSTIPPPPLGEGHMVRLSLDYKFRGDKYYRDLRNADTISSGTFARLYRRVFLLANR